MSKKRLAFRTWTVDVYVEGYNGDTTEVLEERRRAMKRMYSVMIVYDGQSPRNAANSLCQYILQEAKERKQNCKAKVISAADYNGEMTKHNKVIVIGHHQLARRLLSTLTIRFDSYGMKYAYEYSGNLAVLSACRSELGTDGTGKKAFAGYYGRMIPEYKDIANAYHVPLRFGQRSSTRQSQYDLLWLIFAQEVCMTAFLDMPYAHVEHMSFDEILEDIAANMKAQAKANADKMIEIKLRREDDDRAEEKDQNVQTIYLEPDIITDLQNTETMDFLRSHLHYGLYMTDMWQRNKPVYEVPEDELQEGEIDAMLVPVGCYLVRRATRVYVDDYADCSSTANYLRDKVRKITYEDRCPVDKEKLIEVKKCLAEINEHPLACFREPKAFLDCAVVIEISAKHITELSAEKSSFHYICMIRQNMSYVTCSSNSLSLVASIKDRISDDDICAKLYVKEKYVGSSVTNET